MSACNCGAGTHCEAGACVADAPPSDGGAGKPDLVMATCAPACAGMTPYCNPTHHCVTCLTDDQCPAGTRCSILGDTASCVAGCSTDDRCRAGGGSAALSCCGMQCADTSKDPRNCGACGTICNPPHGAGACVAGKCTLGTCAPGWADCNKDPSDGCEANLHVDPKNCTACGTTCAFSHALAACSDACYLAACAFGYDDCDADPKNGCEVPTLSDPKNCGMCGKACGAPANSTVVCANNACLVTGCNQGFADCDGNPMNGCEQNISNDKNNCGACKNVCGNALACINGSCTCQNCNIPNAKSSCVNNQCVFQSCLPGFADCNNNTNDGCEVNLGGDPNNCSACGMVCPMNMPYCAMGVCGMGVDHGPIHTFVGLMSDFYISTGQGGCSVGNMQNAAVDAAYFCTHFYGANCAPKMGYMVVARQGNKMHKNGGCTSQGTDIPNTMCDQGACKMWQSPEVDSGLTNLVCHCN